MEHSMEEILTKLEAKQWKPMEGNNDLYVRMTRRWYNSVPYGVRQIVSLVDLATAETGPGPLLEWYDKQLDILLAKVRDEAKKKDLEDRWFSEPL